MTWVERVIIAAACVASAILGLGEGALLVESQHNPDSAPPVRVLLYCDDDRYPGVLPPEASKTTCVDDLGDYAVIETWQEAGR